MPYIISFLSIVIASPFLEFHQLVEGKIAELQNR